MLLRLFIFGVELGNLVVAGNTELFPLLPHTPELSSTKMIWDEVKGEKGSEMKSSSVRKQSSTHCARP